MIKFQRRKRQLDIFWLLMGSVAEIVGLALLVPFADSLLWHEESWIFLVPAVLAIALGLSFSWLGRDHKRQINVWEGALFMVVRPKQPLTCGRTVERMMMKLRPPSQLRMLCQRTRPRIMSPRA